MSYIGPNPQPRSSVPLSRQPGANQSLSPEQIIRDLQSDNENTKSAIRENLQNISKEEARIIAPSLIKIINGRENNNEKRIAIHALQWMGDKNSANVKEVISDLIQILNNYSKGNSEYNAIEEIPYLLLQIGAKDQRVTSALINILKDTNNNSSDARDSVISALVSEHVKLTKEGLKKFTPYLIPILQDQNEHLNVRLEALAALGKSGDITRTELMKMVDAPKESNEFIESANKALKDWSCFQNYRNYILPNK